MRGAQEGVTDIVLLHGIFAKFKQRRVPKESLRVAITIAFLLLFLFQFAVTAAPEDDPHFEVSATKFLLGTKVDILV
ncbi:MAG: hypothetical protein ACE5I1_00895, partial [bacterium]